MRLLPALFLAASTAFSGLTYSSGSPEKTKPETNRPGIERTEPPKSTGLEHKSSTGKVLALQEPKEEKKTEYKLYPETKPYNSFRKRVSKLNEIEVREYGNKDALPELTVLIVHGGPGAGCKPAQVRRFDPEHYRIICVDQRASGNAVPKDLDYIKSKELIYDINLEKIIKDLEGVRKDLGIKKWGIVHGGSFGSLVATKLAEDHPGRVRKLMIGGVMLGLEGENEWLFERGGAQMLFPIRFRIFEEFIPKKEQANILEAYFKRLNDPDINVRREATRRWNAVGTTSITDPQVPILTELEKISEPDMHCARYECYFFMNNCFVNPKDELLRNAHKLKNVKEIKVSQGQWDMQCPISSVIELKKYASHVDIVISTDAGHKVEGGTQKALLKDIEEYKLRVIEEYQKR